jgi:hypothetical protein
MNRTIMTAVCTSLLTVLLVLGANRFGSEASAQAVARGKNAEVVLIVCEAFNLGGNPTIAAVASSSSSGAPSVPVGSDCAPTLAALVDDGYQAQSAGVIGIRVQYTLIKR